MNTKRRKMVLRLVCGIPLMAVGSVAAFCSGIGSLFVLGDPDVARYHHQGVMMVLIATIGLVIAISGFVIVVYGSRHS